MSLPLPATFITIGYFKLKKIPRHKFCGTQRQMPWVGTTCNFGKRLQTPCIVYFLLREGNVFVVVCHSVEGRGAHVTIIRDALNLTIHGTWGPPC